MASEDECCDVCVFEIEEEEELDPRIEDYLEILNNTSQEINLLESELDRARNQFRNLLGKSTQKLNASYEKLGKCVPKARQYYVLLTDSKEAQAEAHKAAVQFQRANSVYQVAKETVALAEERVTRDGARKDFDTAWQEMLNHATQRFAESEEEKAHSEELHMAKAMTYGNIKQKLDALEKDMPKTIAKAKPYFDLKDRLEYALKQERQNVEDLQRALSLAKQKYKATLQSLESISESIHEKRRVKASSHLPLRTPGVGAESIYSQSSDTSDLPSINLDIISETSSGIYLDDDSVSLGSRVSRTPSGCSVASRTPGVGTSCDIISQNGYSSADKASVEHRLESASIKDISESERVDQRTESACGQVCSGLTKDLNAETTAQLEQVALAVGGVDSSQHAAPVSVNLSQGSQRETCMQTHTGSGSSLVHSSQVENGHKSCESCVDGASGVDDVDGDVVECSEVKTTTVKNLENGSATGSEKGCDAGDTVREAARLPQLSQLPRHRKLRGAQFPILVGLSDCSRQPVPPLGPAPLAFYPPIPQPPQAVNLTQGGAHNHLTDQSLDTDDQRSDQKTEVEVFV